MPKIIEKLPEKLMDEAGRQILENGFSAMTIRSVASACGVGVGTVYNYYPSRDSLVAAFLMKQWNIRKQLLCEAVSETDDPRDMMLCCYDGLIEFLTYFRRMFAGEQNSVVFTQSSAKYHVILRNEFTGFILPYCKDDFTAEFIAEALVTWAVSGKSFADLYAVLEKLLDKRS